MDRGGKKGMRCDPARGTASEAFSVRGFDVDSISMDTQKRTIVFDWGDTLMRVFPEFSGAMADWPRVAAVEGAAEALAALDGRYTLLVGTNAVDSSAEQIRAALDRVGIGHYFQSVFSFKELGARKPETGFYQAIERITGQPTALMVMVGDDYRADISGAWSARWRPVWLNPGGKAAPALLPLQAAEIRSMSELPRALEGLDLPGVDQCAAWLVQAGASAALLGHVQAVAGAAYQMAVWLRGAGQAVDPLLAHRGGLLHDLGKLAKEAGSERLDHGQRAEQMLAARGQAALAVIARRHLMNRLVEEDAPQTWEEKLVYFADKIVEGSRVVDFEERLEALRRRYPQYAGEFEKTAPAVTALRAELCERFGFEPGELTGQLRKAFQGE